MKAKRKRRLLIVLSILAGVGIAVSLTVYALRQNINLFYAPSQIAAGEAPLDRTIRIGGLVLPGSVKRDPNSLRVEFDLTDNLETVKVHFQGILPDLFREGQGIVARGALRGDGIVQAEEVLAKHDENYMPPEVAESLQQAGMPHGSKTQ
ncbi:MAG: cytochrome c maturation protein CcmE [Candidatus Competibacteraceae bacterium]|nr:cytochrome c maturation protein CcmE [Candidatus Competibacteraceae bacterium]